MKFAGDVALITGASKGIGAQIARQLAQKGLKVLINYASSDDKAIKLQQEIRKDGGECELFKFDVSDFEKTKEAVDAIIKKYKKIDYLINNAGVTADNLLLKMKEEDFDKVISVNLKGAFNCTKHISRYMIKSRFGVIINVSSVVGLMGNAGQSNYSASKSGLIGLTKSLAKELGSRNIRVNAIAPGFIETEMTEKLNILQKKTLTSSIALRRLGSVEDVANLVEFLLSEHSSYITGEVINISGGLYI
jgi:3-oxoacyl-[acyl-carrier protein] reductase